MFNSSHLFLHLEVLKKYKFDILEILFIYILCGSRVNFQGVFNKLDEKLLFNTFDHC